jgi:hypothetical protein
MSEAAPDPTTPISWKVHLAKYRHTTLDLILKNLHIALGCLYILELIIVFALSFISRDYALLCVLLMGLGVGVPLLSAKERGRIDELAQTYPKTLLGLNIFMSILTQAITWFAALLVVLLIATGAFELPFLFFLITFIYEVMLEKSILYMSFGDRTVLYTDYLANTILETRYDASSSHEGVQKTMGQLRWCLDLTNTYMLNESGTRVRHIQSFLEAIRLMLYSVCPEVRGELARQVRNIGSSVRSPEFPLSFVRSLKEIMGDTDLSPRGLSKEVETPTLETSLNEYAEQHPIFWNLLWLALTGLFNLLLALATRT